MPDAPDWYQSMPGSERHLLADMGELAARLGSPVVYDRQGQVIWFDRFRGGLSCWDTDFSGAGAACEIVATNTEWSGYAANLIAGSTPNRYAHLMHRFSSAEVNKWGLEIGIAFPTEFNAFMLTISRYVGTLCYFGILELNRSLNKLRIWDGTVGWVEVEDLIAVINEYVTYHNIKVVVDMENMKYERAMIGNNDFEVDAYNLGKNVVAPYYMQALSLSLYGRSGYNDNAQLGHVIMTVGEP